LKERKKERKEIAMPPEEILSLRQREPFEPFRICLTDGTSYDINFPEMVLPGRRALVIGIPNEPTLPLYGRTANVSLLHITRLEPLAAAANPG